MHRRSSLQEPGKGRASLKTGASLIVVPEVPRLPTGCRGLGAPSLRLPDGGPLLLCFSRKLELLCLLSLGPCQLAQPSLQSVGAHISESNPWARQRPETAICPLWVQMSGRREARAGCQLPSGGSAWEGGLGRIIPVLVAELRSHFGEEEGMLGQGASLVSGAPRAVQDRRRLLLWK